MTYNFEKDCLIKGDFTIHLHGEKYVDLGGSFVKVGNQIYNMDTEASVESEGVTVFGVSEDILLTEEGAFDSEFNQVELKTMRFK